MRLKKSFELVLLTLIGSTTGALTSHLARSGQLSLAVLVGVTALVVLWAISWRVWEWEFIRHATGVLRHKWFVWVAGRGTPARRRQFAKAYERALTKIRRANPEDWGLGDVWRILRQEWDIEVVDFPVLVEY